MKNAEFIVIHGIKNLDRFMKAADLFNGKNLGTVEHLTITYKETEAISIERAGKVIPYLKEAFEKAGEIVSFIHLVQIRNNDDITLNSKIKPYVDMSARQISNGYKSFVLKHFIEAYTPFKCETDNNYYITEII